MSETDLADNQMEGKDTQVTRAESKYFRASITSVADNMNENIDTLIQKVRRSISPNQMLQRRGIESNSFVEMGVDGPYCMRIKV